MAVTIRDVSKRCGLSVSAVSKALNNYPDVSEETRQRVLRVAQEIGYHPNALARGLKTNRTYNLGVILAGAMWDLLQNSFFVTVLSGFKQQVEKNGYDITLVNHNIGGTPQTYLTHCRYRNVDGVCVMCGDFFSVEMAELVKSDVPLVTVDHLFSGRDCVMSDNKSGMRDLMTYVIGKGHRRIAFIHGSHSSVTDARLAAFYEVLDDHHIQLPDGYVIPSAYHSTHRCREATERLLAMEQPPTCILMTDDYSALGGIEAIQKAGLRVPEDISVVGYDGISLIQKIRPRLTTMRQEGEEMGRLAALRLVERLETPNAPIRRPDIVRGTFLEGETVATPRYRARSKS